MLQVLDSKRGSTATAYNTNAQPQHNRPNNFHNSKMSMTIINKKAGVYLEQMRERTSSLPEKFNQLFNTQKDQ